MQECVYKVMNVFGNVGSGTDLNKTQGEGEGINKVRLKISQNKKR